jgi:YspA, cpYpsA-related SLOG family
MYVNRTNFSTQLWPLLPAGPKIAFIGGLDFNDHRLIWDRLDKVHAKHPHMVLLHGGSPKVPNVSPPRGS